MGLSLSVRNHAVSMVFDCAGDNILEQLLQAVALAMGTWINNIF
jgi:hypothetical protein